MRSWLLTILIVATGCLYRATSDLFDDPAITTTQLIGELLLAILVVLLSGRKRERSDALCLLWLICINALLTPMTTQPIAALFLHYGYSGLLLILYFINRPILEIAASSFGYHISPFFLQFQSLPVDPIIMADLVPILLLTIGQRPRFDLFGLVSLANVAVLVVSAFHAGNADEAVHQTFYELPFFLFCLVCAADSFRRQLFRGLTKALLVCASLSVLTLLTVYIERLGWLDFAEAINHRPFVGGLHPNHFSQLILVLVPLLLTVLPIRSFSSYLLHGAILLTALLLLILIKSRIDTLSLILFVACYLVLHGKSIRTTTIVLVVFVFVIVISFFSLSPGQITRWKVPFEGDDGGRIEDYRVSAAMIELNPLLGVGLSNRKFVYPLYRSGDSTRTDSPYFRAIPHNFILGRMAETGIPATALLVILYFLLTIPGLKPGRPGPYDRLALISVVLLSISLIGGSLLITTKYYLLILLPICRPDRDDKGEVATLPGRVVQLILCALFAVGVLYHLGEQLFAKAADLKSLQAGGFSSAKELLIRRTELNPYSSEAWFGLAELCRKTKQQGGVAFYREAIRLNPDFAKYYNRFGEYLFQLGEIDLAYIQLEKAWTMDRANRSGRYDFSLAKYNLTRNDQERAIILLKNAVRKDPAHLSALMEFVRDRRRGEIMIAELLTSADPLLLSRIFLWFYRQGAYSSARKILRQHPELYNRAEVVFAAVLRGWTAEIKSANLTKPEPDWLNVNCFMELALGRYDLAVGYGRESLARWWNAYQGNLLAHHCLGYSYKRQGRQADYRKETKAIAFLSRAIAKELERSGWDQPFAETTMIVLLLDAQERQ